MERYKNDKKLIADANELKLTDGAQVLIYHEDKWHEDVFVDLEGKAAEFEKLKPHIVFVAQNLNKMDAIVQKYSALHGDSQFAESFEAAYILLDEPDRIGLVYFGTKVNTEFEVVFQHINGGLILRSFGMTKDIPAGWDKGES